MINYGLNECFCCFFSFFKELVIISKEIIESGLEYVIFCYSLFYLVVGFICVWCLVVGW